ncbi:sarcosine oxidase subunit gamma [Sphingomonas sp. PAMC 26621]|uniref:sarcosine oxidase subunit gamma n=1 Tax=Sphingomonas sp. PAMC 26621 TaxID=1112213 RepID=UPI0002893AB8|nr:sarcosine oxidase subunit gamma [Sphingomonas sp. PAMC 26621]
MIDAHVAFAPARDIVAVDLWDGILPIFPGARAVQVEPNRWWLIDAGPHAAEIAEVIADRGACTAIGGGFVRATLSGPGWRDLLSVSGFLDTGAHALPPGAVARTVLHHVAVTVLVTSEAGCEVYCAASYAQTLEALWHGATGGK